MQQNTPSAPDSGAPMPPGAPAPARRTIVRVGAAAGLGAVTLAGLSACGSEESTAGGSPAGGSPAGGSTAGGSPAGAGSSSEDVAGGGGPLAKLSDVPVGGTYAAAGANGAPIVIAQPTAGEVVAFSAACTHQGCKVAPVGKTLNCPCHGATFDAFTGKNLSGPGPSPLTPLAVKVAGTDIVAG